ncbi:MAG: DUF6612 family protein [Oscillospiraceae bacterium]
MKRLLCVLLVLVLGVAMVGFRGPDISGAEGYSRMNNAMANVEAISAGYTANMNMSLAGISVPLTMDGTVKAFTPSTDVNDMQMIMTMNMNMMGETIPTTMYVTDGKMYMDLMGEKMAMAMGDQAATAATSAAMPSSDELVTNLYAITLDDGYELGATVPASAISPFLAASETEGVSIKVSNIDIITTVDQDFMPRTQHMVFTMDMTIEGETVHCDFDMMLTYRTVNAFTSLEFPSDLSSYADISEEMLAA